MTVYKLVLEDIKKKFPTGVFTPKQIDAGYKPHELFQALRTLCSNGTIQEVPQSKPRFTEWDCSYIYLEPVSEPLVQRQRTLEDMSVELINLISRFVDEANRVNLSHASTHDLMQELKKRVR